MVKNKMTLQKYVARRKTIKPLLLFFLALEMPLISCLLWLIPFSLLILAILSHFIFFGLLFLLIWSSPSTIEMKKIEG